jgi:hypothetical protein
VWLRCSLRLRFFADDPPPPPAFCADMASVALSVCASACLLQHGRGHTARQVSSSEQVPQLTRCWGLRWPLATARIDFIVCHF